MGCERDSRFVTLGDLRGVAGGDGKLGCLCGKAGTSHLYDCSAHSSMLWLPFDYHTHSHDTAAGGGILYSPPVNLDQFQPIAP